MRRDELVDFHAEKRSNATHASTTDPEARLARKGKGKEAKLCLNGHVLMENRNGLVVDVLITQATGMAEREAASQRFTTMLEDRIAAEPSRAACKFQLALLRIVHA